MSGHHLATVRRAGRKRGARFEMLKLLGRVHCCTVAQVSLLLITSRSIGRRTVPRIASWRGGMRSSNTMRAGEAVGLGPVACLACGAGCSCRLCRLVPRA